MTPSQLAVFGRSIYGSSWKSDLADALGVNRATVRRWLAGETVMKEKNERDIHELLAKKADHLSLLAGNLVSEEVDI